MANKIMLLVSLIGLICAILSTITHGPQSIILVIINAMTTFYYWSKVHG